MKRKNAKEILAESLRELAESRSIDKITIQDIVENCAYSPATFYRQFRDKYDLIAWDYSGRITTTMDRIGKDGYTWRKALLDTLNQYQKEKDYLSNLLVHTEGHDSFIRYMSEIHYRAYTLYLKQLLGSACLDKETELCTRLYCLGATSLNAEWILGKIDANAEKMATILEQSLPDPLRQYFLRE